MAAKLRITRSNGGVSAVEACLRRPIPTQKSDPRAACLDADGVPRERQSISILAECRYEVQGFEPRAARAEGEVAADDLSVITGSSHDQRRADYGDSYRQAGAELITLRPIGVGQAPRSKVPRGAPADGTSPDRAPMSVRPTTLDDGRTLETPRHDRTKLRIGDPINGPAVLHQHDSKTLVPPGRDARPRQHPQRRLAA